VTSEERSPKTQVIAYEKQTGTERWRVPISSGLDPTAPIFVHDDIIISQFGGVMVVDRVTGQSTTNNKGSMSVFSTAQSALMVGSRKRQDGIGLFRLTEAGSERDQTPVIHLGQEVELSPMINTYSGVALSQTHVLSLLTRDSSKLIATPWSGESTPWTYELKDDGVIQALGQSFRDITPDAAPFYRVHHRFLPFYVYYKLPDEDVKRDIKLIILDLNEGKVIWESARVRQFVTGIRTHSVMYRDGVYRFIYKYEDHTKSLLFLDSTSGVWQRAVSLHMKFEDKWFSAGGMNYALDASLFDGERILGFVRDTVFSYHWKTDKIYAQGSGQVRVRDDIDQITEVLGPLIKP